MRGVPRSLKSSVIALLYRSEIAVRTAATELANLDTVEVIRILGWQRRSGTQVTKGKVGVVI